jgi:arylsulfatase A-like enzyme
MITHMNKIISTGILFLLLTTFSTSSVYCQKTNLWGTPITKQLLEEKGKLDVKESVGDFNANEQWEQSWRIWLPSRGNPESSSGYLKVNKSIDANSGKIIFEINQVISENNSWLHSTRAQIECQNDKYATPMKWQKSCRFFTTVNDESMHLEELDSYTEGRLDEISNDESINFASSFTLFDAIQRMSLENLTSLDFTLLDELDKVKKNHSIRFKEETTIQYADKERAVKQYLETGEGLLPWEYFVDFEGRLLLAIIGMRTYVLDPECEDKYSGRFEHPEVSGQHAANLTEEKQGTFPKKKPNILFITTDQQEWHTLSSFGNKFVNTPNLDQLAKQGVSFRQSYTMNPVCSPARATWLTGLTPAENGVIHNGLSIVENIKTVGNVLSEEGYETVFAGKLHVGIPKSFNAKIPGFSKVLCQGIGGKGTMGDQVVSSVCEGYLQNRDKSKPFFLSVNFLQPHDICNWISRFSNDSDYNPFSNIIEGDLPSLPENFNAILDEPEKMKVTRKEEWNEQQWRYYLWSYYRMIEEVDSEIGRVLRALEQSGEMENTVIIFNSDHGEGLAHHQTVLKSFPYEEACNVPLIISFPKELKRDKLDDTHLVSGLDIVPTICDFAGAQIPENAKGWSIRSIASGKNDKWRDFVVLELNQDRGRVLRTNDYKLITFRDEPKFLFFDMKNDPGETKNLALEEDYQELIETHIKQLEGWEANLVYAPNSPGLFKVSRD